MLHFRLYWKPYCARIPIEGDHGLGGGWSCELNFGASGIRFRVREWRRSVASVLTPKHQPATICTDTQQVSYAWHIQRYLNTALCFGCCLHPATHIDERAYVNARTSKTRAHACRAAAAPAVAVTPSLSAGAQDLRSCPSGSYKKQNIPGLGARQAHNQFTST